MRCSGWRPDLRPAAAAATTTTEGGAAATAATATDGGATPSTTPAAPPAAQRIRRRRPARLQLHDRELLIQRHLLGHSTSPSSLIAWLARALQG